MARSFVDTDLLEPEVPEDLVDVSDSEEETADRLARKKEQIQEKVADAAEEIERLQLRQKELEQARQELRELHRKQHEYEDGKKDLIEKLHRKSILLQKEEERLTRVLELVSVTRDDFQSMLTELRAIREDQWSESGFASSLDSALALLESIRGSYTKARARLVAQGVEDADRRRDANESASEAGAMFGGGWGFCFRVGIVFSLSLGAVGAILLILFLHFR